MIDEPVPTPEPATDAPDEIPVDPVPLDPGEQPAEEPVEEEPATPAAESA